MVEPARGVSAGLWLEDVSNVPVEQEQGTEEICLCLGEIPLCP